jgi:hypothetical protein
MACNWICPVTSGVAILWSSVLVDLVRGRWRCLRMSGGCFCQNRPGLKELTQQSNFCATCLPIHVNLKNTPSMLVIIIGQLKFRVFSTCRLPSMFYSKGSHRNTLCTCMKWTWPVCWNLHFVPLAYSNRDWCAEENVDIQYLYVLPLNKKLWAWWIKARQMGSAPPFGTGWPQPPHSQKKYYICNSDHENMEFGSCPVWQFPLNLI